MLSSGDGVDRLKGDCTDIKGQQLGSGMLYRRHRESSSLQRDTFSRSYRRYKKEYYAPLEFIKF